MVSFRLTMPCTTAQSVSGERLAPPQPGRVPRPVAELLQRIVISAQVYARCPGVVSLP
jgi:hypothetical protein